MKAFTQMKEAAFGDKPRETELNLSFKIGLGLRREQRRTAETEGADGRTDGRADGGFAGGSRARRHTEEDCAASVCDGSTYTMSI